METLFETKGFWLLFPFGSHPTRAKIFLGSKKPIRKIFIENARDDTA
jgi:hypothetical protein